MKNVKDILKEVTKGDTNINDEGDMYSAGISIEHHGNMIECHANTPEEAEAMRDILLTLIFERVIENALEALTGDVST